MDSESSESDRLLNLIIVGLHNELLARFPGYASAVLDLMLAEAPWTLVEKFAMQELDEQGSAGKPREAMLAMIEAFYKVEVARRLQARIN